VLVKANNITNFYAIKPDKVDTAGGGVLTRNQMPRHISPHNGFDIQKASLKQLDKKYIKELIDKVR